jgi:hypothetical protein
MKRSSFSPIRRTRLRPVSAKRSAQLREYAKRRKAFLELHPDCPVFAGLRTTEIHHMNHREGDRLNDERYWLAVSRAGHRAIHAFPAEARAKGWLV